jgi:hypothetical protein
MKMPRPCTADFMSFVEQVPKKNHRANLHIAFLISRGRKLIATATNAVGSRSRGCGYSERTIHAERAVIKKVGDINRLRGAILVVIRLRTDGTISNSKPCHSCSVHLEKCMREHGLRCVYHS